MRVKVRIFGEISRIYGDRHILEIEEGSNISSVIKRIQENTKITSSDYMGEWPIGSPDLTIIVNGKNVDLIDGLGTKVHNNDDIVITTYAEGG